MLSGDERRRAADELRRASTGAYRHVDALDVIAVSVGVDTEGKLGHEIEAETYAALADLIDPTCKDEADVNPVDGFMCSACGWWGNAQQAWNNGWGEPDFDSPTEYAIRFCPNCGARVVRPNGD